MQSPTILPTGSLTVITGAQFNINTVAPVIGSGGNSAGQVGVGNVGGWVTPYTGGFGVTSSPTPGDWWTAPGGISDIVQPEPEPLPPELEKMLLDGLLEIQDKLNGHKDD